MTEFTAITMGEDCGGTCKDFALSGKYELLQGSSGKEGIKITSNLKVPSVDVYMDYHIKAKMAFGSNV